MDLFLLKVCRALKAYNVRYALVGGYAVALQGAVRGTLDVDIIISLSVANYQQTERALKSLGLRPHLPLRAAQVFEQRRSLTEERNLVAWSFVSMVNPLEVVDVIITFPLEEDMIDRVTPLNDVGVNVLKIEHLIAMKKASGRPQDLSDVKALELIQERRQRDER